MFTEIANQDGVDLIFSDELRASIDQALETSCEKVDNACYASIRDLVYNPYTNLESRKLSGGEMALAAIPLVVFLFPWMHQGAGQSQSMAQSPGGTSVFHIPAT